MAAYFFRSEPGAAELRRLARHESGRVCQRVLMIANLLEGMEHEDPTHALFAHQSHCFPDNLVALFGRIRAWHYPKKEWLCSAKRA